MKTITIRQIALVVDAGTLSHLTDAALADYAQVIADRRAPDAASRFPGEALDRDQLSTLAAAVAAETKSRQTS